MRLFLLFFSLLALASCDSGPSRQAGQPLDGRWLLHWVSWCGNQDAPAYFIDGNRWDIRMNTEQKGQFAKGAKYTFNAKDSTVDIVYEVNFSAALENDTGKFRPIIHRFKDTGNKLELMAVGTPKDPDFLLDLEENELTDHAIKLYYCEPLQQ